MSIVDSRGKSDSRAESKSAGAAEQSYVELLGRAFRIVEKGLDPDEVASFLQATAGSSDDAFQRLEQFSALQAAAKTMEDSITQARHLAEYAKKQAETEARQKRAQATEEAERQATTIIDQAKESCISFVDSTHVALLEAIKGALGQARETVSNNLTRIHGDIEEAAKSHLGQWETDVQQSVEQPAGITSGPTDSSPDDEATDEEDLEKAVPDLISLYGDSTGPRRSEHSPDDTPATDSESGESPESKKDAEGEEASSTAALGLMDGELVEAADSLYSGSVRVIIPRGVKETWMHQFQERMSQAPGVSIQEEFQSNKERIEVTLSLDKPIALIPMLRELPNVRKVMEAWNAGGPPEERGSGRVHQVSKDSGEVALILQFA
ncbi:MAG: hypothetical protein JSV77_00205 [Dehalococcoidales bacterium]|nr:MAG: hypothetical protein JSV77_00205 [Dehalococcoidales bacterium]